MNRAGRGGVIAHITAGLATLTLWQMQSATLLSKEVAQNAGQKHRHSGGSVDQAAVLRIEHRLSLTEDDVSAIQTALPQLLGRWMLLTEFGEEGEFYGRLLPPWGDGDRSAFLIEREDEVIILTDNLSKWDRCDVSLFPSAMQAMAAVQRVVQGQA